MSNISPDFIHSVESLYEEINIQHQDFLNEDSEYYDAEMSYLVEDILSSISTSMVHEGYSANAIIGFLADSSTQDILEKYLTFDENILSESTISEEYIQEQLEIFDYCIDEGWKDKLLGGALKLAGRVASKPARSKFAQKLASSTNPEKTRAAMQRLAQREARKGKVGGYSSTQSPVDGGKQMSAKQSAELLSKAKLGQVTQKVKDIATKAKPVLQKVGKGAAIFGLGAAGGYVGAKMAGAGSGSQQPTGSPKPSPSKTTPKPSDSSKPSTKAPSVSSGATSGATSDRGSKASSPAAKSKSEDKPRSGETPMQKWARLNPKLAAKVKPGESGYEEISMTREKPSSYEKQDQTPTQGSASAQIDTKSVQADIERENEKLKKKLEQQKKNKVTTSPSTTQESYEPYDIVLEYLIQGGHADTIEEANYIMLEMDTDAICTIVEDYNDYILAQEVSEWVNGLLDEGYDLSEYSWDDIIEYYVVEAKYGTEKGRKKLAKKVRAGKDVGEKGSGFEKIVKKASPKYGKERATKIAAAAMWKNLGK